MTTAHTDPAVSAPNHGPGTQLAQARVDLHLAQEDVAAKLHLSTRLIQALEQDDYGDLPGATYVRGYLKSYALLLGLSPDPILEAHARLTATPAIPDFRTIAPQKEITSRHHQVRFVTYLMSIIVIGLAIAWWQGRDVRPPNPLLVTRDSEPAVTDQNAVPEAGTTSDPGRPTAATPSVPDVSGLAEIGKTPPVQAAPSVPAAASTAANVPPPVAAIPAPVPLPAGPRIKLVLHADQDSWADIRDARQTKLLYSTILAGHSVTLEGIAPLSIFLGNAAGVRLDYNGRDVDIARHQRGMIARFTLGEDETAAVPAR